MLGASEGSATAYSVPVGVVAWLGRGDGTLVGVVDMNVPDETRVSTMGTLLAANSPIVGLPMAWLSYTTRAPLSGTPTAVAGGGGTGETI